MDIISRVKNKYTWLTIEQVKELVDNATGWYYACRYPCEPYANKETRPLNGFMDEWAILRLCDEIAERNGFNTTLGYKENGISFTFDRAWISKSLKEAIVPTIGVI